MPLPPSALFAFNANLDHLRAASEADLKAIEDYSPALSAQIDECFSYGVQKEVQIDSNACSFFLSKMKFDRTVIGGQAGNAAEQASALGVGCLLHSNFANESLVKCFSCKEKIYLAGAGGFAPAASFSSEAPSAHHFVLEHPESRTRFIASYDPVPLHLDADFCAAVDAKLPLLQKAFICGLHLLQTPGRLQKFADEIARWKSINPSLEIFCEMGEFQKEEVREACRKGIFPLVDMVGLNGTELSSFGCSLEELASEAKSILFHTPEHSLVLPRGKERESALAFAEKCASFLAKNGRHGTLAEILAYEGGFVEEPVRTVGLGDAFSCAYFMSC